MRWPPKPQNAPAPRTREVWRFALLPIQVEDIDGRDVVVWLEPYTVYQERTDVGYGALGWRTLARFAR